MGDPQDDFACFCRMLSKTRVSFCRYANFVYFCIMKYQIDWIKVLVFFLVAGGLIFITGSFLMSLGIFLLLLIIDGLIAQWQSKKEFAKKWTEMVEEEKKHHDE